MSELKPCPFCKAELEQFNAVAVAHPSCGTGYCLLSGRVLVPSEFDRFNRRPIEDELRATIRKMDQEHTQSLDGKLAMVGKLEELEGLREKIEKVKDVIRLMEELYSSDARINGLRKYLVAALKGHQ